MPKRRGYLSTFLFGGMAFTLLAILTFTTIRNIARDKALLMDNALSQGYWIARSLEIGHSMMHDNHVQAMRQVVREIEKRSAVRTLVILDGRRKVLIASDITLEGTLWPDDPDDPPEEGRIVRSDARSIDLVFPAFFAKVLQSMHQHHPQHDSSLDGAKWILLTLDASAAHAHYRDLLIQSVIASVSTVILGLAAFFFFGMIQKYQLANASIAQLEQIKHHLARFVPRTVQKLIEDNPSRPSLDKVEREATVLFLDIAQYTKMSAGMAPEALNSLIETYFAAFLDIIISAGGDINETAGDGIMAIFTGKSQQTHALNAVRAALAIREQAGALNRDRLPPAPEVLVNIGINTGRVLLGATMIKGAVGERFTYTASGMVTNIASRLCGIGHAGDIHLSETTALLVQEHFQLHGPCAVQLKHVPGTFPLYTLATPEVAVKPG